MEDGASTPEETHCQFWQVAKNKGTIYSDIFAVRPYVEFLQATLPLRTYFGTCRALQPYWIHTRAFNKFAGVRRKYDIVYRGMADYRWQMLGWIGKKTMETLQKLVSEGEFPTGEEIDLAIRVKSKMTDLENKAKSSQMCGLLIAKNPDLDFWTPELLAAIDHAARTNFEAVAYAVGMPEDAYLTQLSKYTRDVVTLIEAHHKEHPLLPKVIARFKWVMNDRHATITPLPLMTDFVFVSIVSSLGYISNAINTVSTVFHPKAVIMEIPCLDNVINIDYFPGMSSLRAIH
jgi:hypothetical protein